MEIIVLRDLCPYTDEYRCTAHRICNLKYNVSKEICIVFHNGFNYGYHFIIKELAKAFKGKFNCFVEKTENAYTF